MVRTHSAAHTHFMWAILSWSRLIISTTPRTPQVRSRRNSLQSGLTRQAWVSVSTFHRNRITARSNASGNRGGLRSASGLPSGASGYRAPRSCRARRCVRGTRNQTSGFSCRVLGLAFRPDWLLLASAHSTANGSKWVVCRRTAFGRRHVKSGP